MEIRGCPERKKLLWHQQLLNDEMPLSIGGGIGQSRLCMYFLRKAHVGEIQASLWPDEMMATCRKHEHPAALMRGAWRPSSIPFPVRRGSASSYVSVTTFHPTASAKAWTGSFRSP